MRTVNNPYIARFFSEDQYASLTKIVTKSRYFYSALKPPAKPENVTVFGYLDPSPSTRNYRPCLLLKKDYIHFCSKLNTLPLKCFLGGTKSVTYKTEK